jgi:hypothetical protein
VALFRLAQSTPPVKATASARWAFVMEALRAATLAGPRAALSWWGVLEVPEGGEKHGPGVDDHPQPPAQAQAQRGQEVLVWNWLTSHKETG